MEVTCQVGDRVTVKSTHCGVLDGGPDIGTGEVVEVWNNRGARTLIIRVDGLAGRYLRLDEQVAPAHTDQPTI